MPHVLLAGTSTTKQKARDEGRGAKAATPDPQREGARETVKEGAQCTRVRILFRLEAGSCRPFGRCGQGGERDGEKRARNG